MFTVGNVDRYIDRCIGRRSGRQSIDTRSILDRHLVDCRSRVDRVSIECRSPVDRYVDRYSGRYSGTVNMIHSSKKVQKDKTAIISEKRKNYFETVTDVG